MRIDRSDPAEGLGDAHMARPAQSSPDDPATRKDGSTAVSGAGPPDSSSADSGSAFRMEPAAYRDKAHAIYRQYAIDHGYAQADEGERETFIPVMRRVAAEDPEPRLVGGQDGRDGRTQDPTIPSDRRDGDELVPRAPFLVHVYELPEGYKSSPALREDPYHSDSVAARSGANKELYAATSRDRAATLGYTTRIPAQKAPFDSHGQEVFTNGKSYITPDADGHNVSNGWKMFSRRGARIGTYDSELNYVKE